MPEFVVEDLGVAAYLCLHGYKFDHKKGKQFIFVCEDTFDAFSRKKFDYITSQLHDFDAKLMSLKKLGEYCPRNLDENTVQINDLGMAAYLSMNGFKIIGRRGTDVFFEIIDSEEEFLNHKIEYKDSPYRAFDNELRYLKKF